MTDHSVETYERKDGTRGWRIKVGDDITATDGGQGYENEKDCLAGLFGNFFGQWDDSFLELYAKWQAYGGNYDIPPEAQEGVPVAVRSEMEAKPNSKPDLGDDPDGDASVDPRDT